MPLIKTRFVFLGRDHAGCGATEYSVSKLSSHFASQWRYAVDESGQASRSCTIFASPQGFGVLDGRASSVRYARVLPVDKIPLDTIVIDSRGLAAMRLYGCPRRGHRLATEFQNGA